MVGRNNQKKKERKDEDYSMSTTMYQTGSVPGITVTTIFLLEGNACRGTYRDKIILTNGAAIGSTIITTPTALMEE